MSETKKLALPLMAEAQAQKHVTHNEALLKLDALVQLSVRSRALADPPAEPVDGEAWIVAAGGTGEWVGRDGEVAVRQSGAWAFHVPRSGWVAWVEDERRLVTYDAGGWVPVDAGTLGGRAASEYVLTEDLGGVSVGNADTVDGRHAEEFALLSGATFTGGVTAAGFSGDGGGLSNVNADYLGGRSPEAYARISGAAFTGEVSAARFNGDGGGLTNIDAAALGGREAGDYALTTDAAFTGVTSMRTLYVGDEAFRRNVGTTNGASIEMGGYISSWVCNVQDGSGRVNLRWNATAGRDAAYVVDGEDAVEWDMDGNGSMGMSVRIAPGGVAGERIGWTTVFSVGGEGAKFAGQVTADGFAGSGAALTDVDAERLGGREASEYALADPYPLTGNDAEWAPVVRSQDLCNHVLPRIIRGRKALLVVCTGQSNAVGSNADARGTSEVNSNVLVWNKLDGTWQVAVPGQYPLDGGGAYDTPNNFAHAFCCRLQKETGLPVYLMLYAYGAHSIVDWSGNTEHPQYSWDVGGALIGQLRTAMAALPDAAGIERPDVWLWMQGEDDSGWDQEAYAAEFNAWLDRIEAAGQFERNRMPYIAGELMWNGSAAGQNEFYTHLARYGVEGVWVATTRGLPLDGVSQVHMSGEAYWQLGYHRMFDVALRAWADILAETLPQGAGLDADTLDGHHASDFALLSGASFTGRLGARSAYVGRPEFDRAAGGGTASLELGGWAGTWACNIHDGTGRVNYRWNATSGVDPRFIFNGDRAVEWDIDGWGGFGLSIRESGPNTGAGSTVRFDTLFSVGRRGIKGWSPFILPSHAAAALPDPAWHGAGALIFVPDDVDGPTVAFSEGTNWRRMGDGRIIG